MKRCPGWRGERERHCEAALKGRNKERPGGTIPTPSSKPVRPLEVETPLLKLRLPVGWQLYDSEEKVWEGDTYFRTRYIHRPSRSGIVYHSTINRDEAVGDRKVFVVEGYGIGTIDPGTFKEIAGVATVQRYELYDEEAAEMTLVNLMAENYALWRSTARCDK